MPFVTLPLAPAGPLIDIHVGVSAPFRVALEAAGTPVPPWVPARLLIDTGASCTCIDPSILSKLGLQPRGSIEIHTPSTQGNAHLANQFDVGLAITVGPKRYHHIPALPVVESNLAAQGIQGLLGRDVLKNAVFNYNGSGNIFLLGF